MTLSMKTAPAREYLYHIRPSRKEDYLDPSGWERIDADNEQQAMKKALEREALRRPAVLYVSKGTLRHENGKPVIVTKYNIQWG